MKQIAKISRVSFSDDTKQEISTALGQVGDSHKANQMNISTDAMGLQEPSTSKESETESLGASQEMSKLRKRPSDAKETSEYEVLTKKSSLRSIKALRQYSSQFIVSLRCCIFSR